MTAENVPGTPMRTITTEYPVHNLWIQRPFELEGYSFTPSGGMAGYQERVLELLASPEDTHTVDVLRKAEEGAAAPPAILWESGELIDDYLTLLSFAQGRSVHYREARWTASEADQAVAQGVHHRHIGRALLRGEQAISPFEVEPFLRDALLYLRLPGWVEDKGFASGVHWYLESLAVTQHELRFVCAWHGIMALVHRYFQGGWEGTGEASSASLLLLAFREAHEYDFVLDEHPPIWEELSKDFLNRHSGNRYFSARHAYVYARKLQLALLLALLDMVGTSAFSRRDSILRDIRR